MRCAVYHIAGRIACESIKVRCAELIQLQPRLMPASQAALPTSVLVMVVAFPHHAAQKTAPADGSARQSGRMVRIENEERCGGE
jgi:hypothetical protein